MQLLFLFGLLVLPYLILTFLGPRDMAPAKRARIGLTLFFLTTAGAHFNTTEEMAQMLPPAIPYRVALIYLTGIFELAGAIGVWIPRLTKITGLLLILMMLAVLPANVYSAFNHVNYGGHDAGPVYLLVRVPFQLFVMGWIYFATEQNWFTKTIEPQMNTD